jgi:hypothetical protein
MEVQTMSYDPADAAYDEFVDQLSKEFRESALEDDELYDRIVDSFKESRLCDFYIDHPLITYPARDTLSEAKALLNTHPRPSLVLAVTASEVFLRDALLTPLLHGSFHTESSADLIVKLIVTTKDERLVKALLQIIATHTGIDLRIFSRPGCTKPLWEEMREIQLKRNRILHQADKASIDEARRAINIAETLLEDLFTRAMDKLGLHLHDGIKICGSKLCRME